MLHAAKTEMAALPVLWGESVLPLAADPASLENGIRAKSQLAENSRQGFQLRSSTLHWASSEVKSRTALGMRGTLYDEGIRSRCKGKERDTETGNDDFGAREYSWRFGRWLSSDWSAVPVAVPYANLTNPQTLNLYSMVGDDPESFADLDAHQVQRMGDATAGQCLGDCQMDNDGGAQIAYLAQVQAGQQALQDEAEKRAQNQVSYSALAANYPGHDAYPTDPKAPNSIWSLIGGQVEKNAWTKDENGNAVPSNSCAVRMSYALNESGLTIPKGKGTVSGADGSQYFLRVADLQKFLTSALGQPQRLPGGTFDGPRGKSGILSFNIPFRDATGHFTLWNGKSVIDPKEPYQAWPAPKSALFWGIQ